LLNPEILAEIRALETSEFCKDAQYLEMPLKNCPGSINRAFAKINNGLYITMQGQREFGLIDNAKLKTWKRSIDLSEIKVPKFTISELRILWTQNI
jgi:proline iminopeptidase